MQRALLPAGTLYLSSLLPSPVKAAVREKERTPDQRLPKQNIPDQSGLSKKLRALTRNTVWQLVDQVKVHFKTWHCQGMVKIGNVFWVSSVEMEIPATGAWDRSKGKGHLFKIDDKGNKLADIAIGEGAICHPSGIDFDGTHIYIAAAEYRPDSQAIVYRFDPKSQQLQELFRWQDHIGGILRNPLTNTLHGISWGSRRFYQWQLDQTGKAQLPSGQAIDSARLNPSFYIDYQDNQYIGGQEIVYTGLSTYKKPDGTRIAVGGIEVVDIEKKLAVHQVPVNLWSPVTGAVITQNPSFFELNGDKLRAYFMPDDNESTIFVYEA